MSKKVFITVENGDVYKVLAHDIANNCATYYAERDKDTTYESEYDFTINDRYELTDWLFNQMDWYELNPVLHRKSEKKLNEMEVIEVIVGEDE